MLAEKMKQVVGKTQKGAWLARSYLQFRLPPKGEPSDALKKKKRREAIFFVKRMIKKSSFYRKYYRGFRIEAFEDLPTIDKTIMMNNFDTLNTVGVSRDEAFKVALNAEENRDFSELVQGHIIGMSSGTSGNRGLFLVSQKESMAYAGMVFAKLLPKPIWKKQRIALFLRANSPLYEESTQNKHFNFKFFDLFSPMEQNTAALDRFQPTMILAPASVLRLLAREQREKKINISPQKIFSVAEILEDIDRKYISESFGNQVIQQLYQCTEGFLGHTCKYGHIHLCEDNLYIEREYLDREKTRFHPIITDLRRETQPIIRYRLNDILVLKQDPCPCGSPFTALEKIEGREDDIFYFPSARGNKRVPVFPDFLRRAVLISNPHIEEYLIEQLSPGRIRISLKGEEVLGSKTKNNIENYIKNICINIKAKPPLITLQPYRRKVSDKKLRRVMRLFK